MNSSCFSWFYFPEACRVNQRIAKALFADNGPLTPADRRTFKNEIEEAVCAYVLKPDNVFLNPWSDGEHEYDSLAVIEISLRKTGKAERIAELFHRTMPYPLFLVLHDSEANIMFSMAEKRISRDGREQVVLERTVNTPWQPESALSKFIVEADFAKFRKTTFRDLYLHYMNLLEALCVAAVTGELFVTGVDAEARSKYLEQLHSLDLELTSIKAQAKKESEMACLIELNMQAKRINHEIHEIHEKLKDKGTTEYTDDTEF